MNKILTYYSIIVSSFVVTLAFISATTYAQLVGASLIFPAFAYFVLAVTPRKRKKKLIKQNMIEPNQTPTQTLVTLEDNEDLDVDRRAFLKLIGLAGVSLFVSSLFARRAEATLFGKNSSGPLSLNDRDGNRVDPAQNQPTDGFIITEIEDAIVSYYGFTNKEGAWFIMREDTETGSFRYVKGESNFSNSWGNREKLKYDYFDNAFN